MSIPAKLHNALKGTVRRELTGVEVVPIDRYSFKDVPLDLFLNVYSVPSYSTA
jgi:hypothetical protein